MAQPRNTNLANNWRSLEIYINGLTAVKRIEELELELDENLNENTVTSNMTT